MNTQPLVSVIVNCFNGEKYLKEAIDSIYAQTYENWEIIFFDNQSSDASEKIAKKYDERLRYIYNEVNVPLGQARKLAIDYANGDWLAFLDVDDIWLDNKLEIQMNFIGKTPEIDLLYASVEDIAPNGDFIRTTGPMSTGKVEFDYLLLHFDINMVTPIIRRKFLELNNLTFDASITASEEYNLFMKCAAIGNVYGLHNVLGKYRVYEGSLTDKRIESWSVERFKTIAACIELNQDLLRLYPSNFIEAIQKGIYYQTRYEMESGIPRDARKKLKFLAIPNILYFFLYIISHSRHLWSFMHNKRFKGLLTNKIKKLIFLRK